MNNLRKKFTLSLISFMIHNSITHVFSVWVQDKGACWPNIHTALLGMYQTDIHFISKLKYNFIYLCINNLQHAHIIFHFRLFTYYILSTENIPYSLELITKILSAFYSLINILNHTFKTWYLTFVHWFKNFRNIFFGMHLPEDGHKSGQHM